MQRASTRTTARNHVGRARRKDLAGPLEVPHVCGAETTRCRADTWPAWPDTLERMERTHQPNATPGTFMLQREHRGYTARATGEQHVNIGEPSAAEQQRHRQNL